MKAIRKALQQASTLAQAQAAVLDAITPHNGVQYTIPQVRRNLADGFTVNEQGVVSLSTEAKAQVDRRKATITHGNWKPAGMLVFQHREQAPQSWECEYRTRTSTRVQKNVKVITKRVEIRRKADHRPMCTISSSAWGRMKDGGSTIAWVNGKGHKLSLA